MIAAGPIPDALVLIWAFAMLFAEDLARELGRIKKHRPTSALGRTRPTPSAEGRSRSHG